MGLIDLKTDLKSLKFGNPPASDRPGGGNSGQPYIVDPIDDSEQLPTTNEDFLLRGGMNAPKDALLDVKRLTKWFFDDKNPSGILFTAKQNALSLIAARTQASGVGPNEGIYTPLSTLGQALGGFAGLHLPKQGLIPGLGVRLYGPKSSSNPLSISVVDKVVGGEDGLKNRLVQLTDYKINKSVTWDKEYRKNQIAKNENNILSYLGGSKSPLGIGRTQIERATDNTGKPLGTGQNSQLFFDLKNGDFGYDKFIGGGIPGFNTSLTALRSFTNINSIFAGEQKGKIQESFTKPLLQEDIKTSTIMSISPSYTDAQNTIDGESTSRINHLSPGQRGNIISYTAGKRNILGESIGPIDKINAKPIYQSSNETPDELESTNDLIQFRIAALNSKDPKLKEYIHFRAYIDDYSDKYSGKWKSVNYMGRAEAFHKYDSFDRDISLSFTVAAQSKEELMIQYKKLNFLASNLAPTYSAAGYMGGPLVTLTVGGWLYEQPGFITGLSLSPMKESPWEIGINDQGGKDESVRELPHIIKVSGFGFTPIHTFRPEKQKNIYTNGKLTSYGSQRYIALADSNDTKGEKGYNENYTNYLNGQLPFNGPSS